MFETFADPVLHLGPLGSGQLAKLLNNFLFTAQLGAAMDTFDFADRLGINRAEMAKVLAHGSGGTRAAAILAASGFDTTGVRQAVALLRKDVGLMSDVAKSSGAMTPPALLQLAQNTLTTLAESVTSNGMKADTP